MIPTTIPTTLVIDEDGISLVDLDSGQRFAYITSSLLEDQGMHDDTADTQATAECLATILVALAKRNGYDEGLGVTRDLARQLEPGPSWGDAPEPVFTFFAAH